jgi:hypothetical protein
MKKLILSTIKRILESPYNGDTNKLLLLIISHLEKNPQQLEILDLIKLFFENAYRKSSIANLLFGGKFTFLHQFDFMNIYYNFLTKFCKQIIDDVFHLNLFFTTLENLLNHQNKVKYKRTESFVKFWKFVYGNSFVILKKRFQIFVLDNYNSFVKHLKIFPHLFSEKALEELASAKLFYSKIESRKSIDSLKEFTEKRESFFKSNKNIQKPLLEGVLGQYEQSMFRAIFISENSLCNKIELLSDNLLDEIFVVSSKIHELVGFEELCYAIRYLPATDSLQEFLLKLYRFFDFNYLIFPIQNNDTDIASLDHSKMSIDNEVLAEKYFLISNQISKKDFMANQNILQNTIEKRRLEIYDLVVENLVLGIQENNETIIENMLLLFRKFLFTGLGFLGNKNSITSTLNNSDDK